MSQATQDGAVSVATPTDTTIELTQTFDAPLELVWRLWNDPAKLPEFWGPRNHASVVDTWEFREGGKWRIVSTDPDGGVHPFRGEFRRIVEGELVEWSFEYEPMAGHVSIEQMHFIADGDRTVLRAVCDYGSREARDAMLDAGMTSGVEEMHHQFVELLEREAASE